MTQLLITGTLLGIALAMDAFSVSAANALNEPDMKKSKAFGIAGTFALFQIAMPLIGWLCVVTVADAFAVFRAFIPWIALLLLLYIGGKMLYDGLRNEQEEGNAGKLTFSILMLQGIATSIDALSVGFTISDLQLAEAMAESLVIGFVTLLICLAGIWIGKKFGTVLSGKASLLGGCILIGIGAKIFISAIIDPTVPLFLFH